MTPKQLAFVRNKLMGLSNQTAVIAAGYSPVGAKQQATCLMKHPLVRAELKKHGFLNDFSTRAKKSGLQRLEDCSEELAALLPKKTYSCPIEFLTDAMNCEQLPLKMRVVFATALLPYQHRRMGGR